MRGVMRASIWGLIIMAGCWDNDPVVPKFKNKQVFDVEKKAHDAGPAEQKTDPERLKKIGQLSEGIRRIINVKNGGYWYSCGKRLSDGSMDDEAIGIASHVVDNMASTGLNIDPYGILGVMFNESRFDACALGIYPRKLAYRKGMLRRSSRTISHNFGDVKRLVNNDWFINQFKKTGIDIGLCQVLSRFHPEEDLASMITVGGGTRICVLEMLHRSEMFNTKKPWLYWRGRKTRWYMDKVDRYARIMKNQTAPRGAGKEVGE